MANEKKQVGLEERRKHAKSKAKKLEKSVKDVRLVCTSSFQSQLRHFIG